MSIVHGVAVDDDLHNNLKTIVEENSKQVHATYPKGSFQRAFLGSAGGGFKLKNAKALKCHPVFIKWCLYVCKALFRKGIQKSYT